MADHNEVVYDPQMLMKTFEISEWLGNLMECQQKVTAVHTKLTDESIYAGAATESLDNYYLALEGHLNSLQMLYTTAIEFSTNCCMGMFDLDGDMANEMLGE